MYGKRHLRCKLGFSIVFLFRAWINMFSQVTLQFIQPSTDDNENKNIITFKMVSKIKLPYAALKLA